MMKSRVIVALVLLATAVYGGTDSSFRMSSLVVPQGVSCRFSPVRLTRDVEITAGTFDKNSTKEDSAADSSWGKSASNSQSANTSSHDDTVSKNVGASAHAGISLLNPFDIGAEAHAKIDKDVLDVRHSDYGLFETNKSERSLTSRHESSDRVVENTKGTHGNYYLAFTMTLKNLDLNDTYTIKPSADGGLKAVVEGLSEQIEVPCVSSKSFSLDIGEERSFRFLLKVVDERLLDELKAMETKQALSKLKPKINGSIFPIISDETGKNISRLRSGPRRNQN